MGNHNYTVEFDPLEGIVSFEGLSPNKQGSSRMKGEFFANEDAHGEGWNYKLSPESACLDLGGVVIVFEGGLKKAVRKLLFKSLGRKIKAIIGREFLESKTKYPLTINLNSGEIEFRLSADKLQPGACLGADHYLFAGRCTSLHMIEDEPWDSTDEARIAGLAVNRDARIVVRRSENSHSAGVSSRGHAHGSAGPVRAVAIGSV